MPLYFHALLTKNPEMTVAFVEAVLSMRGMGRSDYNSAIEGCKKMEEDTRRKWDSTNSKPELGVFSKLNIPPKLMYGYDPKKKR